MVHLLRPLIPARVAWLAGLAVCHLLGGTLPVAAQDCASLGALDMPRATITLAQAVAPGAFTAPGGRGGPGPGAAAFAALPAFCRVAVLAAPTPGSAIRLEVWMPAAGWNGKLQVVGNGGFAGTISYPAMATALAAGYAAASTDTGHTGPAANTFATEDALVDFAHRAIHETAVAAKRMVDRFYSTPLRASYFNGCSTGGRQAVTAAQRYPDDFDGIIAGAPAFHTSRQAFGQIWNAQAMAGAGFTREQLQLVHDAVLESCDGLDGVVDGVIENPLACRFDPSRLACGSGRDGACLSPEQVEAVRGIHAGASNPRTGEPIYTGLEPGSELGWSATPVGYAVDYFRYLVFDDPSWNPATLDFDSHLALTATPRARLFDAAETDLGPFVRRGGRLLLYQGWAEPGIPPRALVHYHERILRDTPGAAEAVRLFMVPGMGHCGGGAGTSTFDMVAALDRWVESGEPPDRVPASRVRDGQVDRTRPLCAWPATAVYTGTGSTDDERHFVCRR
jgi:feruloyl esterase